VLVELTMEVAWSCVDAEFCMNAWRWIVFDFKSLGHAFCMPLRGLNW